MKKNGAIRENTKKLWELFMVALKLGLTSFGGPTAHLGYFYHEYVTKKKWLDEKTYVDLVALCQILPGPASSQVGMGIGVMRAGMIGGIVSFLGFTLPSIMMLLCFALFIDHFNIQNTGWLHGLKLVAVVIVLQAVINMGQKLANEKKTALIAALAACSCLIWPTSLTQIIIILCACLLGLIVGKSSNEKSFHELHIPISKRTGIILLVLFFGILFILPLLSRWTSNGWIALFESFYRTGSLVFGGGHVVLPLLEREFIPQGLINKETFLAGYGAAQAVPGPLFTFATYLGAIMKGWTGAIIATLAIFMPAYFLIVGTLPFWDVLRRKTMIQNALIGVNAAVVGILLAALYDPIFTSSVKQPIDFAFGTILFIFLTIWKLPPWIIVLIGAIGGSIIL